MTKRIFGGLELAILNILKSGKRMTVKEVHSLLGGKDKYNTIMTVMNRLVEKKYLQRERIGLQYEYWVVSAQDKLPSFLEQIKQKLFGINTATVVSHLIESAEDITESELSEIEKIIEAARTKRGKK